MPWNCRARPWTRPVSSCSGPGAAGIAAVRLLITLGAHRNNIFVIDRDGVIHTGRKDLNPYKSAVAADTDKRTLAGRDGGCRCRSSASPARTW